MANKPVLSIVTAQTLAGSTIVGRIIPLLEQLQAQYDIDLLVLRRQDSAESVTKHLPFRTTVIGREPFHRIATGKKRLTGLALIWTMLQTAWRGAINLWRDQPTIVIMVKPLPAVVLAVWVWRLLKRQGQIILDVDDFELTANVLSSLAQRAAIHWSERTAARLANHITAATPFLVDHFTQLTQQPDKVHLLPTGYTLAPQLTSVGAPAANSTILYVGSVSITSGHRVDLLPAILMQVIKQIPNTQLVIAGDGDDVQQLRLNFAKHNLTSAVQWFGRFTTADLPQLLHQSALIIDPIDDSLANRAKSSFRVSLAAATGWPIVTSNIGIRPYWLPDHLHDQFFAAPANVLDYTEKTVHLLQYPLSTTDRHTMSQQAHQYTWSALSRTFLRLTTR